MLRVSGYTPPWTKKPLGVLSPPIFFLNRTKKERKKSQFALKSLYFLLVASENICSYLSHPVAALARHGLPLCPGF